MYFFMCVTSMVSYAILFKNIFSVDGVVNQLLLKLNLIEKQFHLYWIKIGLR